MDPYLSNTDIKGDSGRTSASHLRCPEERYYVNRRYVDSVMEHELVKLVMWSPSVCRNEGHVPETLD